ncbi:MAG: sulfotransferase family protein [Solirubrobacterales bacterium]
MALPTFFIIGAPKAGTTSLHHYLDQHPQIQMSAVKEPRFFVALPEGAPNLPGRVATLPEYEALFDAAVAVRGESSTDYAAHPRREGAPRLIRQLVPDARFVYLVRDPIERSVSHYRMAAALLGERRPLGEALRQALREPDSRYIAPSLYATQLELYLRQFPAERILVVDQAELRRERRATLSQIFAFLAVSDEIDDAALAEEKLSGEGWRAFPEGYSSFVGGAVTPRVRWVPRRLRRALRGALERTLWRPIDTNLDDRLRAQLERLYAPEAERLRQLTGKRFASWSV